jgi:hypothetical protein
MSDKENPVMKEFRLSTAAERTTGVAFTAAILAAFALMLYSLRNNMMLLIFSGLGIAVIAALLIIYVLSVLKAAAVVDSQNKQLHVRGVKNYTLDLKDATLLQTFARKNGQTTVRLLVFFNEEEEIIASVPTMFTFRQGIWADPVAKEMAAALGIDFKQNVPDWQLDKEKYKKHMEEEAAREKREAKERRKKKMEMRIQKRRNLK